MAIRLRLRERRARSAALRPARDNVPLSPISARRRREPSSPDSPGAWFTAGKSSGTRPKCPVAFGVYV
jgi:hypothetical protein